MGKQISVKLSREKEEEFSQFLKDKGAVFMYRLSKSKKINILNNIPSEESYAWTVYIWNKKFKLIPEFTKVKKEYLYRTQGYSYIFHNSGKPVIEYTRTPVYRIYWNKDFVSEDLRYDLKEFAAWYNEVVKWIKKNCKYINGVYVG